MVTNAQVRRLKSCRKPRKTQELAAAKAGMDVKTARRYLADGKLRSESIPEVTWRTRYDPFAQVWEAIRVQIERTPAWEATIFAALQRTYPCEFADGQMRTLQRHINDGAPWKVPAMRCSSPIARTGATGPVRLHLQERVGHHHRRSELSAHAV